MNSAQVTILFLGILTSVFMGLYPPWLHVEPGEADRSMGYGYIWSPPVARRSESANIFGIELRVDLSPLKANAIDWSRLGVQWAVVALTTTGLVLLCRSEKTSRQTMEPERPKATVS